MEINVEQQYFLMSFRFNKSKSDEFGLTQSPEHDDLFTRIGDGSTWKKKNLYDLSWGKENGFVRQPELNLDGLWYLLLNSNVQENEYGAACELQEKYPEELLTRIDQLLNQNADSNLDEKKKRIRIILKMDNPPSISKTFGKPFKQIIREIERGESVSKKDVVVRADLHRNKHPWWKFWRH